MATVTTNTGKPDELDEYIAGRMRNPAFARWWHKACADMPNKLPIDGHEYRRRQRARQKKQRGR